MRIEAHTQTNKYTYLKKTNYALSLIFEKKSKEKLFYSFVRFRRQLFFEVEEKKMMRTIYTSLHTFPKN